MPSPANNGFRSGPVSPDHRRYVRFPPDLFSVVSVFGWTCFGSVRL